MTAAALAILLSSFLLFLVQPIVAKEILPWFGGAASVWIVALTFFQVVLVAGYGYAHFLAVKTSRPKRWLHVFLLLASCLALPIIPEANWKPVEASSQSSPALLVLVILARSVGLPYFLLSSTGPLLQKWLTDTIANPQTRRLIFRLFAVSNAGSLAGLLAYPFFIEPTAPLAMQARIWSAAYVVYVVALIFITLRWTQAAPAAESRTAPRPGLTSLLRWTLYAALGSIVLLSVSNQITQNVAAIPFLWILPLSLYLLSFVVCFEGREGRGWYERRLWLIPCMIAVTAMAALPVFFHASPPLGVALVVYSLGVFCACVLCHGELSRSRPEAHQLTYFYLAMAGGGALGGALVSLGAPHLFNNFWEMPLSLLGVSILGLLVASSLAPSSSLGRWSVVAAAGALVAFVVLLLLGGLPSPLDEATFVWTKVVQGDAKWGCAVLFVVVSAALQRYRLSPAVAVIAVLCSAFFGLTYYHELNRSVTLASRSFYGALRVTDSPYGEVVLRRLFHGVILHGVQYLEKPQSAEPYAYYSHTSGVGRMIPLLRREGRPLRLGLVGMGVGSLAAYGQTGDTMRFFELDPDVERIARHQFSFLGDSSAKVDVVLGDGRLSLERELAQGQFKEEQGRFDLLVVDAFSGDSIPVHLLTRESLTLYLSTLKNDGIIAFHVSNNYLDVGAIVTNLALDRGLAPVYVKDRPGQTSATYASDWVLVARDASQLEPLLKSRDAQIPTANAKIGVWTDQRNDLLSVLK